MAGVSLSYDIIFLIQQFMYNYNNRVNTDELNYDNKEFEINSLRAINKNEKNEKDLNISVSISDIKSLN